MAEELTDMADTIVLLAWTEADGTLGRAALEALTAARSLGSEVTVGLIGGSVDAASTQVGGKDRKSVV